MMINGPRGTVDILPEESRLWRHVEPVFAETCDAYGYGELRLPIFEHSELFLRSVGETTDIVQKEMYTFSDRGHRSITLRPEGTAGVVRSFLEHKMQNLPLPIKLYYNGPMFRYERPEAGRFRQFSQIGMEGIGSHDPSMDAEIIIMTMDFYRRLGIANGQLILNSVGCEVCRPVHRQALYDFLLPLKDQLCNDCQNRMEKNPLRVFDCKNENCQALTAEGPRVSDYLCSDCQDHFDDVQAYLDSAGLEYQHDKDLVRGLDYYTRTVFEVYYPDRNIISSAIGAGGRYNKLVEELGGKDLPGVGVALCVDRAVLVLKANPKEELQAPRLILYIATMGKKAGMLAVSILKDLRAKNIYSDKDYLNRSLKAQMKSANRANARYVMIIGQEEIEKGRYTLRDMDNQTQNELDLPEIMKIIEESSDN
ncbi:MAG: histidine--tRNA ligase [Firmicutes bacterium]|nr:histidine--tRNA ligase [Bacillota bacterium]